MDGLIPMAWPYIDQIFYLMVIFKNIFLNASPVRLLCQQAGYTVFSNSFWAPGMPIDDMHAYMRVTSRNEPSPAHQCRATATR